MEAVKTFIIIEISFNVPPFCLKDLENLDVRSFETKHFRT